MANNNSTWTIQEKTRLCKLLELYPYNAVPLLAKKIETKTEEEVEEYIHKLINSIIRHEKTYVTKKVALHRAPLEEWADMASDLVSFEHTDFSQNLAKVFNVIALYEDVKDENVNYRAIYRFLSQCMQTGRQDDLETLGPLECSIMVDLTHSLMDVLSEHDTYVQSNILKWKHMLLEYRDSYCSPDPRLLKMASENDFDDFIDALLDGQGNFRVRPIYVPELGNRALRQTFKGIREGEVFKETLSKRGSDKAKTPETFSTETEAKTSNTRFVGEAPERFSTGTKAKTPETSSTRTDNLEKDEKEVTADEAPVPKFGKGGGWKRRFPLSKKDEEVATVVRVGLPKPDESSSSSKTLTYTMEREQKSQPRAQYVPSGTSVSSVFKKGGLKEDSNEEEFIKEKHKELNELFAKFTPKTANMAPSMVSLCPASEIKKHKAGAKKRFPRPDDIETPKTEIILVMPPKGVEIKHYTVQTKQRKKMESAIDEEDLIAIEENEEREYYYEVKTCETDQFYNKRRKMEMSASKIEPAIKSEVDHFNRQTALKLAAKKKLDLARKRKLELVKKVIKDREAPVKKSKTYSLNPFCMPLMLVDLGHQ